jgi:hypothetical protein
VSFQETTTTIRLPPSFYSISLPFKTCSPRLVKGSLFFLHRSLLLLSGLLGSSRGLPAALTAPGNRPRRGSGLRVISHHLTYDCAFCSTANPGPGLGSRSGRRRFCRLLLGCRVSRIESGLLDRSSVTGGLVALLLFGRLPFCRVHILLGMGLGNQQQHYRKDAHQRWLHTDILLGKFRVIDPSDRLQQVVAWKVMPCRG